MNAKLTQDELQAIKERAEKATEGPWFYLEDDNVIVDSDDVIAEGFSVTFDGEFIVAARQDIPQLVAEVERLQSELDKAVEFANYKLHFSNQLSKELAEAYRAIERLGGALDAITAHRVNHFLTKDAMVESIFKTAREALE